MYWHTGRKTEAQRTLAELLARAETCYVPAFPIAYAYQGMDDFEQADIWVDKAIEDREARVLFINVVDGFWSSNPHYSEWLRKIGLDS
jgi:hypothetical protein